MKNNNHQRGIQEGHFTMCFLPVGVERKMNIKEIGLYELLRRIKELEEEQRKVFNPYRQIHLDKFKRELKRRQNVKQKI